MPKSRHGPAMIDKGSTTRAIALAMVMMLVAASSVIPSLSYAQKYADHLSQYGGYDARVAAISGFAALYVDPQAPMLPVVLAVPGQAPTMMILPSACAMDKTVLPTSCDAMHPASRAEGYVVSMSFPEGIDQATLRGPPRASADASL